MIKYTKFNLKSNLPIGTNMTRRLKTIGFRCQKTVSLFMFNEKRDNFTTRETRSGEDFSPVPREFSYYIHTGVDRVELENLWEQHFLLVTFED